MSAVTPSAVFATRPHPLCCIFCTVRVCSALTGVGGCWLIISSHVSFNLLLFASLFVFKSGKKLSPEDPGSLYLANKLESFANLIVWVAKPYLFIQGSVTR